MLDSHAPFPVTLLNMKENVQLQRISLVLVFSSKIMLSVHYFFYFFKWVLCLNARCKLGQHILTSITELLG